ncbi:MAG: HAD-IB family hydrolase, partial [Acidimicrobiales bacterium]
PLIPVGMWGSEGAWPRSSRYPYVLNLADPPTIGIRVGEPLHPDGGDVDAATRDLMARILALLPAEAAEAREPTAEELAKTQPPG